MTPSVAMALAERARWTTYTAEQQAIVSMRLNGLMPMDIIGSVCLQMNISFADFQNHSRLEKIVTPRHIAMYLIRQLTQMSYPRIGQLFNRDHSTIIFACQKIAARMKLHPGFAKLVNETGQRAVSGQTISDPMWDGLAQPH